MSFIEPHFSETDIENFPSFWIAGYECADHLNKFGDRVNLLHATGHMRLLEEDYEAIGNLGIRAAREGICWSEVERSPRHYRWDTVTRRIEAAREAGIRLLWDICHFGFPDDLSPLHPHFSGRFADLCAAFVREYRRLMPEGTLYVTPINEISFLSWLGGDACGTAPFCVRQGWEVKYHLCKAFIAGVRAMRAVDGDICILTTEPLINVIAPPEADEALFHAAERSNEDQFQATDILTGRICPELGGDPSVVDMVGVNFYFQNQWVLGGEAVPWALHDRHAGWAPLDRLLQQVYGRYGKPVMLSETSHPGSDRGLWLEHVAGECAEALRQGVPLTGICLYPITDRPDWDFPGIWHRSGLWDEAEYPEPGAPVRSLCVPYHEALVRAQLRLADLTQEPQGLLAGRYEPEYSGNEYSANR